MLVLFTRNGAWGGSRQGRGRCVALKSPGGKIGKRGRQNRGSCNRNRRSVACEARIWCWEAATFFRAIRAAAFIVVHIALALIIIAGLYIVQLGLVAIGDPRFFDWMPVRYVFDAIDIGVLIAFFLFGTMEAVLLFQEHYRGVAVIRGGILVDPETRHE